jgi:hypothetical protein
MASKAVPGFLPSRHGFRFANRWPRSVARRWHVGLVELGIGNVGRGLCGGMVFAARDRFERGAPGAPEAEAPAPESALFREIVDRQFDSFGPLYVVPLRFWLSSALGNAASRGRETVRNAWPAIRRQIDVGRPAMVGLVREAGWNPLAVGMGHQVAGYRYETTPEGVSIGVYDPNHPGRDDVEIRFEKGPGGEIRHSQSTGEPLLGLLSLPWTPARDGAGAAGGGAGAAGASPR